MIAQEEISDFVHQPTVIRTIPDFAVVEQSGGQAKVNGIPASMTTREAVMANPKHYLREMLGSAFARMESGEIMAVVHADAYHLGAAAPANGRTTLITINAEQFAAGADERARFAAWEAKSVDRHSAREAAERDFDLAMNEGGEGYNPYRAGSARTYAAR